MPTMVGTRGLGGGLRRRRTNIGVRHTLGGMSVKEKSISKNIRLLRQKGEPSIRTLGIYIRA